MTRVAVVDSGIHAGHPHVGAVAGGVAIAGRGETHTDWVDRLGHGTAVAAAIREKAPDAELFAVRVFDSRLATSIDALVGAIEWSAREGMHLANLSLGTAKLQHEAPLRRAIDFAAERGTIVVAARDDEGVRWLPGSMAGVLPVQLDWDCPRDEYRVVRIDGQPVLRASGYPRDIPGVPRERNLSGISFAVANVTGFAARTFEPGMSLGDVLHKLVALAPAPAAVPLAE